MQRQFLSPRHKQGSILIVSLWAVSVLSILSVALAHLIFQQIRFTNFLMRSTLSLPLAKAACQKFFLEYGQIEVDEEEEIETESLDYDSYASLTQENEQELCDNVKYKYYFVDKKTVDEEEKIIDESALININLVSSGVIERLPGMNEDLAKAIVESGKRPFKRKEEILLIEDMDKEIFNQFKDLITVQGTGKININTVSSEVLYALGLQEELIDKIMRYRQEYIGDDGEIDTDDDGVFTDVGKIYASLNNFTNLSTREQQDLLALANSLSVKSEYLRFNVVPQIKGKEGIHYSILVNPEAKRIISWHEY